MNQEFVYILQSCIDCCNRIQKSAENQKGTYHNIVADVLAVEYERSADQTVSAIKNIKEQLRFLQEEQKL